MPVSWLPIAALLACMAFAVGGCGGNDSGTKDMTAKEVLAQVKIGMTEKQITDVLGEPSSSFNTATGASAKFLEYESKNGIVAVSIERDTVSGARALGTNDSEKPQQTAAPTDGGSSAEDVPHQFGN
jgi:hypothetical protein